jgi:hypothetical protein
MHLKTDVLKLIITIGFLLISLVWTLHVYAADFGIRGGVEPANVEEISSLLRKDSYDLELLISFGTSKGGSAGHLALAIRDGLPGDDLVYSANFYADRSPEHAEGFYTNDLMVAIPKIEYLFKTHSSLGDTAAFGLDFGEIYKRSVIGIRISGVPAEEKAALAAYFQRINEDFHSNASDTEYHRGEIKYDYMHLNCAKTIGSAFKFGAGYTDLAITSPRQFLQTRLTEIRKSNIPTEMAMKLIEEWDKRGYGMDVVLYKKYSNSSYIDPHEAENGQFKDLPNRFPSVKSRDFLREQGEYKDYDNLYAMYLLYNMGKYSIKVDESSRRLEIEQSKAPLAYTEAAELAAKSAKSDSRSYRRQLNFLPKGVRIGETPDNTHLYNSTSDGKNSEAKQ